jgi:hypothetical protein
MNATIHGRDRAIKHASDFRSGVSGVKQIAQLVFVSGSPRLPRAYHFQTLKVIIKQSRQAEY